MEAASAGVWQEILLRSMALRITTSLRMQAVRADLGYFPHAHATGRKSFLMTGWNEPRRPRPCTGRAGPGRDNGQKAIATMMLQMELYHLGDDFPDRYPELIGAVTRSDIQRVARKYIHPESLILILVADPAKVSINASRF